MHIGNGYNINFGSARLNIASFADTHGDILGLSQTIKTIQEHHEDIFERKDDKSTQNVLAIGGDYFMNPAGQGYLTNPAKTFGDVQFSFLNMLIYAVKRIFSGNKNFEALYTPGNHCFGGGDGWLFDKLYNTPVKTLLSNVNLSESKYLAKLMKRSPNIMTQKIYEIPDDKNPDIKNHVLFMGVTIPSLYYNMNNIKYTKFLDQTTKNDATFTKSDLKETIKMLRSSIKDFKKDYPDGAVVVIAHTGNKLANIFAHNVDGINLILNAHDHKDFCTLVNGTQVLSHGQNNQFVRGVNIVFDDNGKLSYIKNQKYDTAPYITKARKDEYLDGFIQKMLKKDLKPLVFFDKETQASEELVYNSKIRYTNNVLANYITSAIKHSAEKQYPELDAVGIPATIIRSGLRSNNLRSTFNNIDLFNMFKGADTSVSGLRIGAVSGYDLMCLILENVRNNIKSQTRNALIQWSDVQINKSLIMEMLSKKERYGFDKAIKIRNKDTGDFEPINLKKEYTVILPDKYLLKQTKKIKVPSKIIKNFTKIPEKYSVLFKEYLSDIDGKVKITDLEREQRII